MAVVEINFTKQVTGRRVNWPAVKEIDCVFHLLLEPY